MKTFIKKNKFFVSLISLALITILSLSVYIVLNTMDNKPVEDVPSGGNTDQDIDKDASISALSAHYNDFQTSNSVNTIVVAWSITKNSSEIEKVNLYLNDDDPLDVTSFSSYYFPQSVYNFPTGDNKIKLEVTLEDGKQITKETKVYVDYIISLKQEVTLQGATLNITLEYVYMEENPVKTPTILTNDDFDIAPFVKFVGTQEKKIGNRVTARATYNFAWESAEYIPHKMAVRWKFNDLPVPFSRDYTVVKPDKEIVEEPKD